MTHPGPGRLQRYALDELDLAARLAVDEHLTRCPRCRREVESEARLDGWLLASVPADAGSARNSLDRLWSRLETEAARAPAAAPVAPSPRRGPRMLAAAAVLAAAWIVARQIGGPEPSRGPAPSPAAVEAGRAGEIASGVPESAPLFDDEGPVDPERLAAVRSAIGESLRAAQERLPHDAAAFAAACDEALSTLRREGWPLDRLVRDLALGDDEEVAAAALRWAASGPSGGRTLAAAIERAGGPLPAARRETALACLLESPVDAGSSHALVRALAACAAGDGWTRATALGALACSREERAARALTDLAADAERAWRTARGAEAVRTALVRWWQVLEQAPAAVALGAWRRMASEPEVGKASVARFLRRADEAPAAALALLRADPGPARPVDAAWRWVASRRRTDALPVLADALDRDPDEVLLRGVLIEVGGVDAAELLAGRMLEAARPSRRASWRRDLVAVLDAGRPTVGRTLGARRTGRGSDALLALAAELPADHRPGLLLGALRAWEEPADPGGRREALVRALARWGDASDGRELLAWIASRPDEDPLLPLAWAAAASLAGGEALTAWSAAGHDRSDLADAAMAATPRFAADVNPSDRVLEPLRRSLRRAAPADPADPADPASGGSS